MTHVLDVGTVSTGMANNPPGWPPENTLEVDVAGVILQGQPDFANISGSVFPEKRISVSQNWVEFLNPALQMFPGQNSIAFDHLFSVLQDRPSEDYIARMVSVWLANAMTRSGAATLSNGMC